MQRSMHVSASAGRWICPDEGSRWNVREGLARVLRGGMLGGAALGRGADRGKLECARGIGACPGGSASFNKFSASVGMETRR